MFQSTTKIQIGVDFTTAFQTWDLNVYKLQYSYNVREIEYILYLMMANHFSRNM